MRTRAILIIIAILFLAFSSGASDSVIVEAAKKGDIEIVKSILSKMPDKVHFVDESGYTALHWAGMRAHWDILELLMDYRPDVNAVGADGGTPVHWACHHDRPDIIKLLLDREGKLDIQNQWGRTPMHTAVRRGCKKVVTLLLQRGANLDARTKEGWTPLHVAYRSGHKDVINLLISRGASQNIRDNAGKTPKEMYYERPSPISIDPKNYKEYVGEYAVEKGFAFKVWTENDRLYFLDFAPDMIYPIAKDTFFCEQEPWKVTFIRDENNRVYKIEVEFIRRKVSGTKLKK
ncbi:MAG: ankyrin repeat domain-containing protein [Candidatus Aminicenantes bacterium]|nr:MAG: ankyrin repeat domain-containing protein [Candidatus Aminicenantes bacterium]